MLPSERLSITVRRRQASRDTWACLKGHVVSTTSSSLVPEELQYMFTLERWGGRGEGRYHTGKWLQERFPASQAEGRPQSRLSSRAHSHTFASLSPSILGTLRVSLWAASVLFPSRKTTAPSSIPSCKKRQTKAPQRLSWGRELSWICACSSWCRQDLQWQQDKAL